MNFLGTLFAYYRNFWNVYQLARHATRVAVPGQTTTQQQISLVLIDSGNLQGFLHDLPKQDRQPDELVLVLRSPGADLKLASSIPLTIIRAENVSVTAARNRGIAAAKYPVVVVMETDMAQPTELISALTQPLEAEAGIGCCVPRVPDISFFQWLDQPYAESISPLSSWRAIAFRKVLWARTGGIPEDIPPFAAWSVFLARLLRLEVAYCLCNVDVAVPVSSVMKMTVEVAFAEGSLGLSAHWAWKQTRFALPALGFSGLSILLFVLSPWIGLAGTAIALLLSLATFGFWGRSLGSLLPPITSGWLAWIRFIAFALGVRQRSKTLLLLNSQAKRHLKEIVAAHPDRKGIVVYFPTHDWGNMFQRPHQMARQFARAGYLFFYGTRNELSDAVAEFLQVEPNLYLTSMPAVPPETFRAVEPVILYIGSTWHAPMLDLFSNFQSIYDHYDDLAVSGGLQTDHQILLERSNVVLASSHILVESVQKSRPDALFIPNAVDDEWVRRFEPKPGAPVPSDLAVIQKSGKPVIGYSGALAEWFDYPLLMGTAKRLPDFEFVLLGIDYDGTLDKSGILDLPNVHWLGQKPYADLFNYVWRFDVAIIPFCSNDITLATSPIKLYEYFCCRKPVVSTALPEVMRYNEALIAGNAPEFSAQIRRALEISQSVAYQESIQKIARANTWQGRVNEIIGRLK